MMAHPLSHNPPNNRQDGHDMSASHVPQPGSPTLTNPDMILPDYEVPDTDDDHVRLPQAMWNNGHSIADGFQFTQNDFYANPDPFSTPILYGNGTMLSDIGEVTEVESNAGTISRNTSRHSQLRSPDDGLGRSSLMMGNKIVQMRQQQARRERRLSGESTSTINTHDGGAFIDFDESASVGGDSNFQGDDEESLASSYVDDSRYSQQFRLNAAKANNRRLSDDVASTVSISKRAEEILANAKMRLTHMEDNLTRARTFSYSSVSDGSTPSPTFGGSTTTLRKASTSASHTRNMSENVGTGGARVSGFPQRSASALGAAGGYRQPLPASRSMDALGGATGRGAYTVSHHYQDTALEPLGEDDDVLANDIQPHGPHQFNLGSPTFGSFPDPVLSHSTSVTQMRDLQDQMKGLKGKISSLREQARADSMKRRSLQSLRTPSPFTNATWEEAQAEAQGVYKTAESPLASLVQSNEDVETSAHEPQSATIEDTADLTEEDDDDDKTENGEAEPQEYQEPLHIDNIEDDALPAPEDEAEPEQYETNQTYLEEEVAVDRTQASTTNEETALEDYESESGESLYHDSFQRSVSHEDRADAFDYEHFFLHSAMSTMGGARLRSESVGSSDSVETTRGPIVPQRRSSVDSTASVDTFETATEGLASRSSTAQSAYRVYTPADLFEDARRKHGDSFRDSGSSNSDEAGSSNDSRRRTNSVVHRPLSTSLVSSMHRPSYSSFESTGTNRSFPLVNKTKINGGILTPGGSPDHGLKQVTESLMNDASSIYSRDNNDRGGQSPAIQALSKETQTSVEALVASLGKCVLALSDVDGAQDGGHDLYKRRIEAARRILEGEVELP